MIPSPATSLLPLHDGERYEPSRRPARVIAVLAVLASSLAPIACSGIRQARDLTDQPQSVGEITMTDKSSPDSGRAGEGRGLLGRPVGDGEAASVSAHVDHPAGRILPLADPGDVGLDAAALARVDQLIEGAIESGITPGASLAIGRRGRLVRLRGYGRLDTRPGYAAVSDSSIYDVASLTKVVGTTTAAMILFEEGRFDLDATVAEYLPELNAGYLGAGVTVRQLLLHTAGLPPFIPLWREYAGRDAYLHQIAQVEPTYEPGSKMVYSDLGMILVGLMIERISGQTLDAFLQERLFGPLGMTETGFNPRAWKIDPGTDRFPIKALPPTDPGDGIEPPLPARADTTGDPAILARIAPTEVDTVFRMTHLHAVVHDENAYAIGGVAGHAGLFSSARDLALFAQLLLDGGTWRDVGGEVRQVISPETIRTFTTPVEPYGRTLGWDTPANNSSIGSYFSPASFGHTGFTGTSIWIDPEREIFVVLLTNRVNPTRANSRHVALRREVHDAIRGSIVDLVGSNESGAN